MSRLLDNPESLSENTIGETELGTEEQERPGTEIPDSGENEGQAGKDDQEKTPEQGDGEKQENVSDEIPLRYDEIMERIDQLNMKEDPTEITSLTDSIRSLVDLMKVEPYSTPGYVYEPPEIPIEGYQEWDYPIIVDYLITIVGYGEPVPQSNDYDDPDQFLEDFQAFAFECYKGDVYSEFIIDKVWGADGKKIYDSQGMEEPEPDPGEEEPNETVELLLSHLENIDAVLEEMQQADLEYYQSVAAYQEEMLKLQTADTGATIILCIAVFAVLGELAIKHLLEVFR